jgi:hypothetical protein
MTSTGHCFAWIKTVDFWLTESGNILAKTTAIEHSSVTKN